MFLVIIAATVIISLIALGSILVIFRKENQPAGFRSLISLAAGSLLAVSFLDLLPEAIEESEGIFEPHLISALVLVSILIFFIFERILHWHHCPDPIHPEHNHRHHQRGLVYLNLIGDAIHNFIDGFLVAGAFLLDFQVGLSVTAAVILHEIPQEISDFGVLLYAGLSRTKAIIYNLTVALTAILGATVFYFLGESFEIIIPLMAAVAAGNFIYLATADLIPELHHETNRGKIVTHSAWLLFGVAMIYIVGILFPHS
ncbi:MAG: ZIP family metal transporter [Candidatus Buchananbacteria bacterium]|nr:ZIP family metal transporter [Candidatus Buchananbacteria bacterium]